MKTTTEYLPLNETSNVLITGSTGLIGGELLKRLISGVPKRAGSIWSLVRANDRDHAQKRILERLERSGIPAGTLDKEAFKALRGDVTKENWGLDSGDMNELSEGVDIIIHCASDTSFLYSQEIYESNVASIKNLIELAGNFKKPPLLIYISTAANVGDISDENVTEEKLRSDDIEHHNLYTRSKADCEKLLKDANLPYLIFRPSIVLSAGIDDPEFASSILWMIPLIYSFDALPIKGNSRIDVVPVGFVCESILELLSKKDLKHRIYHISAGKEYASSVEEAFTIADLYYGKKKVELLSPESWSRDAQKTYVNSRERRELYHRIKYYFPFLNMNVVYDNQRLKEELPGLKIERLKTYMPNLLSQFDTRQALKESVKP